MTIKTAEQLKNEYAGRDPLESWIDLVDSLFASPGALFDGVTFDFTQPDPPTADPITVTLGFTLGGSPIDLPMNDLFELYALDAAAEELSPTVVISRNNGTDTITTDSHTLYKILHSFASSVWSPDGGAATISVAPTTDAVVFRIALLYRDQVYLSGPIELAEPAS